MSSVHLSTASLPEIAQKGEVAVPAYDRAAVRAGIVHFGVGGFHRAHQARYLDELMNAGTALDFGIVGMGVMPSDARMRDALKAQDCLYTLVEKAPDGTVNPRVIGSIIDYVFAPDDPAAAVAVLADAAIRIVSLTVTEGGYNFDHVKGEFNLDQEHVAHDIAELKQGREDSLRTFFGLITAALMRRRAAGDTPFTVMSCDNIQGNGHVASAMFHAFAEAIDPQLAQWIRDEVPFPNSMVDRITPETTDADRADVADAYGYTDEWPVVCEDFTQWVLEDNFVAGRPEYEDAGVQVVQDVVHDNLFADFLLAYMEQEATPSLRPVPGVDLDAYRRQLISRFGNEAVKDTVARLCAESSDRIPKWLLPVIRENIATGRPVELSAAIVASWARYDEGVDEQGEPITIVDALADRLHAAAQHNREDILAFVRDREIFGDLVDEPAFTQPYEATLRSLHEVGSIATLNTLLGRS